MNVELKVPVIGESVTEVTLSNWLKKMVIMFLKVKLFVR